MLTTTLLTAALLVVQDAPPEPPTYEVAVRMLRGDPLGGRDDGTQAVYAEPRRVVADNETAYFRSAGQQAVSAGPVELADFGTTVRVTVRQVPDGKLLVRVEPQHQAPTPAVTLPDGLGSSRSVVVTTRQVVRQAAPGVPFRVRVTAAAPDQQAWVEVTVRPVR